MGLDTTHDCWSGPYHAFMRWRSAIAQAAGMPPLLLMEGHCPCGNTPIKWESLKPSPLHVLLDHSDCDGLIPAAACEELADALEALLPDLEDDWQQKTQRFINGLRRAAAAGEPVEFH